MTACLLWLSVVVVAAAVVVVVVVAVVVVVVAAAVVVAVASFLDIFVTPRVPPLTVSVVVWGVVACDSHSFLPSPCIDVELASMEGTRRLPNNAR